MSLRQAAASAATDHKDAERVAAAERFEAELAKRRAKLLELWAPVATEDNTVLVDRTLKVSILKEKHDSGVFASRATWWEPVEYSGSRFQVDDLDVFVFYGSRNMASSSYHATIIKACHRCENWCVLPSYGFPDDIHAWSDDPEKRRADLMKAIGQHLTHRTLCHLHHAEKINASCRACGRPFHEE